MKVAGLLLAAGGGTRFGGRKQLADIRGTPLVVHGLQQLAPLFPADLYTVVGAYREEVRPLVAPYSQVIEHPDWVQGLGSSIARGMHAIIAQADYDGVLIALADQLALTCEDYARLLERFDGRRIVAAHYAGKPAVPALFPARLFAELARLTGDVGARRLLRAPADALVAVPLPRAERDLDRPWD